MFVEFNWALLKLGKNGRILKASKNRSLIRIEIINPMLSSWVHGFIKNKSN